ncbi:MAG TPA: hypothetical protein VM282_02405 [Acidimicrobiales bacterium]|nr:hypothetical protein [Acidimicrobiales bacterium]
MKYEVSIDIDADLPRVWEILTGFTWEAGRLGLTTIASHCLEQTAPGTTTVTLPSASAARWRPSCGC